MVDEVCVEALRAAVIGSFALSALKKHTLDLTVKHTTLHATSPRESPSALEITKDESGYEPQTTV